jgi:hypothetical protein
MSKRFILSTIGLAAIAFAPAFLAAQSSKTDAKTPANADTKAASKWVMPRTADGKPDLNGYWTSITFTPMERPAKYGNREFLTDEETKQAFDAGVHESFDGGAVGNGDEEDPTSADYDFKTYGLTPWQEGVRPNNRTSLVVDPPDGRIPPLTAAAKARRAAGGRQGGFASYFTQETQVGELKNGRVHADTAHDLDLGVQCVSLQAGPPIGLGGGYNKGLFIVQGKDSIAIETEYGTEVRVIPIGTRPHPSSGIRQWHADGVAHWDGDTLVVEDTNFRPETAFRGANPDTLKITEYFKRVGPEQIEYKYTVDDPSTWTKPWTVIGSLTAIQGPLWEYACSEDNIDSVQILVGARNAEKAAADKAKAGVPISQK